MSAFDRIKIIAGSVGKFMGRYADEASDIADALRTILPAIPIGDQDRAKVERIINDLDGVADRIVAAVEDETTKLEPVTVKASDVKKAVEAYLKDNPSVITDAIAKDDEGKSNEAGN